MIYFIRDAGSKAIKIGISSNPSNRLADLQTAHSAQLILLGVMDGGRFEERALHRRFDRLQGEWFKPTDELLAYIKANAKPFNRSAKKVMMRKRKPQQPQAIPAIVAPPPAIIRHDYRKRDDKPLPPNWEPRSLAELLPQFAPPIQKHGREWWEYAIAFGVAVVFILLTELL